MPLLTSLKCPDCGEITQTPRAVRPGETIPCDHCGGDIPIRPARKGSVEDAPVGASLEPDLLRELLDGEDAPPLARTGKPPKTSYHSVTNERLPAAAGTDQPFVRNPLAQAAASSKERLIGGKGVRFVGPREFMAAVLIAAVAGVVYFCFWGLHDVVKETEKAGDRFAKQKEEAIHSGSGSPGKKSAKGKASAPAPIVSQSRAEAGTPVRIGVTEVTIVRATRPGLTALPGSGGLTITLRIQNYDAKPITYYKKQLVLRDRSDPTKAHPLLGPPAENLTLAGKQIYDDVLEFGPTSMMSTLELDLPASGSDEKFQFSIPNKFIQTSQ